MAWAPPLRDRGYDVGDFCQQLRIQEQVYHDLPTKAERDFCDQHYIGGGIILVIGIAVIVAAMLWSSK